MRRFRLGPCTAELLTDLVSTGLVQYEHVLRVASPDTGETLLWVASERNASWDPSDVEGTLGSHFLGVFPGDGHRNLGASCDWADLERFTARALEVAREQLGIEEEAEELPGPDDLREPR